MGKTAPVPSSGRECGAPEQAAEEKPRCHKVFMQLGDEWDLKSRPGAVGRVHLPGVRTEPTFLDGWPPCQTPAQDRG